MGFPTNDDVVFSMNLEGISHTVVSSVLDACNKDVGRLLAEAEMPDGTKALVASGEEDHTATVVRVANDAIDTLMFILYNSAIYEGREESKMRATESEDIYLA